MRRRISITLPGEMVRFIDRIAAESDRSHFIAEAMTHYGSATGRAELRKRLKEGALRRAERDRRLAWD